MTDDTTTAARKIQSRGEARRRAMIEAAWQVMQDKGCEAATLNDIISLSGGSRATLYEAFGGKDGLLEAAVAERCSAFSESMQLVLDERNDPRAVLLALAAAFLEKVFAPESIRTMGIFCAEGGRFPHMIETFLRHGPRELSGRVARYLESATRAGKLQVEDPELAADLFLSMLQGQWVLRVIAQCAPPPTPEQLRSRAETAVAIFLDGLGAGRKG
ncbi:transcriptional regulator, TetR family [Tistlia consotensis]|uniref:Transcriptional regulator, TetR family n=1 Tax=Tistlia consotensis USBA 355 TaxID=560819 RepID=A0A1Y6C009_9PROT|nr:TetR/AcrR family transcriptional regulator [Tistlia consotensis]SMF38612.1 transcriptional regulator, TetR family [Tistlia consotensis USBA 355]SNR37003.1 transcriptional regulator, TetR family [Tistlia consotensis]